MARETMFMTAIGEALNAEMARDDSVFLIGEDIAGGTGTPGGTIYLDARGAVKLAGPGRIAGVMATRRQRPRQNTWRRWRISTWTRG